MHEDLRAVAKNFDQIGTVEIVNSHRHYSIDPHAMHPHASAIVPIGTVCPLYSDGYSTFWVNEGLLNVGGVTRAGDGMITAQAGDVPSNIVVHFPSRIFGPDEWESFTAESTCREGDFEQRIRIALNQNGGT